MYKLWHLKIGQKLLANMEGFCRAGHNFSQAPIINAIIPNIDTHRGPVTRIIGSFADHCTFAMQSHIKLIYKMDELDKIDTLIYRL